MKLLGIKSGKADVIASGVVISYDKNPITLTYGNPAHPLHLTFEMIDEEGKKEPRMNGSMASIDHLVVKLINFKNPLGTGSVTPISLGTYENRKLFIHFRVYELTGSKDRTIEYTLYLEEGVSANG